MYKQPVYQIRSRDTVDAIVSRVRGAYRQKSPLVATQELRYDPQFTNGQSQRAPLQESPVTRPGERFITPPQTPINPPPQLDPGMQTSPGFMDNGGTQTSPGFMDNGDMQSSPGFMDNGDMQTSPGFSGKYTPRSLPNTSMQKPAIQRNQPLTPTAPQGIIKNPIQRPTDPRRGAMQNFITKGSNM